MADQPAPLQFPSLPPAGHAFEKFKMVIVVRADLGMSSGKIAAQCVHAALAAYRQALVQSPPFVRAWEAQGEATICVQCSSDKDLEVFLRAARCVMHRIA
jgi:PTH2 family peptidyl-tRNA hydrolase